LTSACADESGSELHGEPVLTAPADLSDLFVHDPAHPAHHAQVF
jgi:hypothetical protein